jgi:hypothetical protein
MRIFSVFLMLVFFVGMFITGIIYLISKAISGISFNPESNAWKTMLERLRKQAQKQLAGKLVPWDQEIMSLLSFNRSVVRNPGFFDSTAEGVYTTIFHEPVLAYASQVSGANSVTVARTSDREFIFRKKAKETEIWINGQPFAVFTGGALIAAGRTNRVIAQLNNSDQADLQLPVMIGDKEVASLSSPGQSESPGIDLASAPESGGRECRIGACGTSNDPVSRRFYPIGRLLLLTVLYGSIFAGHF